MLWSSILARLLVNLLSISAASRVCSNSNFVALQQDILLQHSLIVVSTDHWRYIVALLAVLLPGPPVQWLTYNWHYTMTSWNFLHFLTRHTQSRCMATWELSWYDDFFVYRIEYPAEINFIKILIRQGPTCQTYPISRIPPTLPTRDCPGSDPRGPRPR